MFSNGTPSDSKDYLSKLSDAELLQLYRTLDGSWMIDALSGGLAVTTYAASIGATIEALSDPVTAETGQREEQAKREEQARRAVGNEIRRRFKSPEHQPFYLSKTAEDINSELSAELHEPLRSPEVPGIYRGSLNYRSPVKRAILVELTQKPSANDLEICRGLDADGAVELPARWQAKQGGRLFFDAYMDPVRRRKIEITISKVRADMRQKGLLPSR
jgi:hypothetical protein